MLERALLHKDQLIKKFTEAWDNIKNIYYFVDYNNLPNLKEDDWDTDQFVSINKNGNVVGYISCNKKQSVHAISSISLIALSEDLGDRVILLYDLQKLIHDYFYIYNYNRVSFGVYIGNPVEKFYDKFVSACGGKVCGYYRQCARAMNGVLFDFKEYEILAIEYKENVKQGEYKNLNLNNTGLVKTYFR